MDYWVRLGVVLLGMAILVAIWAGVRWVVGWFRPRLDDWEAGLVAFVIMAVLFLAASFAALDGQVDDSARCGLGTVRIEERVWAGKSYRTEFVCVVDQAR